MRTLKKIKLNFFFFFFFSFSWARFQIMNQIDLFIQVNFQEQSQHNLEVWHLYKFCNYFLLGRFVFYIFIYLYLYSSFFFLFITLWKLVSKINKFKKIPLWKSIVRNDSNGIREFNIFTNPVKYKLFHLIHHFFSSFFQNLMRTKTLKFKNCNRHLATNQLSGTISTQLGSLSDLQQL